MKRKPKVKNKQAGAALKKRESAELPDQIREKIQQRAYELYELRGREDGRDFDDWLKAESEVTGKPISNDFADSHSKAFTPACRRR